MQHPSVGRFTGVSSCFGRSHSETSTVTPRQDCTSVEQAYLHAEDAAVGHSYRRGPGWFNHSQKERKASRSELVLNRNSSYKLGCYMGVASQRARELIHHHFGFLGVLTAQLIKFPS